MRLKFGRLSILEHQNMAKPIPHCSKKKFGKNVIFSERANPMIYPLPKIKSPNGITTNCTGISLGH